MQPKGVKEGNGYLKQVSRLVMRHENKDQPCSIDTDEFQLIIESFEEDEVCIFEGVTQSIQLVEYLSPFAGCNRVIVLPDGCKTEP